MEEILSNGKYSVLLDSKNKVTFEIKEGRVNGLVEIKNADNKIHKYINFVDGMINGEYIEKDKNGNVIEKTKYIYNKKII